MVDEGIMSGGGTDDVEVVRVEFVMSSVDDETLAAIVVVVGGGLEGAFFGLFSSPFSYLNFGILLLKLRTLRWRYNGFRSANICV